MNFKFLISLAILFLVFNQVNSQNDSISYDSFKKYSSSTLGFSFVNFTGNVSNFTKAGGSLDLTLADGNNQHFYGLNINIAFSDKLKEFSIPDGYEHYNTPATFIFGFFYGNTFSNIHESHFYGLFGINYGWLLHKKNDDNIGGYRGFIPQIEFGRSFRIGKHKFSDLQYTSQYTPMRYDPSISNQFIDIYTGYKHLFLNDEEGKGGVIVLGIRYKINKFSINKNLKM